MSPEKRVKIISAFLLILISALAVVYSNNSSTFSSAFKKDASKASNQIIEKNVQGDSTTNVSDSNSQSQAQNVDQSENSTISEGQETYQVVKVVDGDTLEVNIDGPTKIRVIGIDTPETVDPRKPVQCFGKEASNKAKEILTNQYVTIQADPTQDNKDRYGRLLRYVYLPDGTDYGLFMISSGYAHEYTYDIPYEHQAAYKQAQKDAMNGNKGLWSPDTCSGNK